MHAGHAVHLPSSESVIALIDRVATSLSRGGTFVLTYRDLTQPLDGLDRFVPIRSDDERIMLCVLDVASPEAVTVSDLIYTRSADAWELHKSSYSKLRISPEWLRNELQRAGLRETTRARSGKAREQFARSGAVLWTRPPQHAAHHLYEALGYHRAPGRDCAPGGHPRLAYRLALRLRPDSLLGDRAVEAPETVAMREQEACRGAALAKRTVDRDWARLPATRPAEPSTSLRSWTLKGLKAPHCPFDALEASPSNSQQLRICSSFQRWRDPGIGPG